MEGENDAGRAADNNCWTNGESSGQIFSEWIFHEGEVDDAENSWDANARVADTNADESKNVDRAKAGQDKWIVLEKVTDKFKPWQDGYRTKEGAAYLSYDDSVFEDAILQASEGLVSDVAVHAIEYQVDDEKQTDVDRQPKNVRELHDRFLLKNLIVANPVH